MYTILLSINKTIVFADRNAGNAWKNNTFLL